MLNLSKHTILGTLPVHCRDESLSIMLMHVTKMQTVLSPSSSFGIEDESYSAVNERKRQSSYSINISCFSAYVDHIAVLQLITYNLTVYLDHVTTNWSESIATSLFCWVWSSTSHCDVEHCEIYQNLGYIRKLELYSFHAQLCIIVD